MGFHRIMLSKWADMDYGAIFTLLWPFMKIEAGTDKRDQRASVTFNYLFPSVGFEVYFEWGRNDYSPNYGYIMRYPFHAAAYTFGSRKHFNFSPNIQGELALEITNLESSRDYEFLWKTTFYQHHIITQGYTNRGQWLGAGFGTGGNSQYLGFTLFYKRGYTRIFLQRQNIDNDYVWFLHMGETITNKRDDEFRFKAFLSPGIVSKFIFNQYISVFSNITISDVFNPKYDIAERGVNVYFSLGTKLAL
jgi:hypothetical protein